jgi:hypothetical protein
MSASFFPLSLFEIRSIPVRWSFIAVFNASKHPLRRKFVASSAARYVQRTNDGSERVENGDGAKTRRWGRAAGRGN